jgi:ribosome-associated protein
MEDTANEKSMNLASEKGLVLEIATLLEEHRGEDTMALDVRGISSWTDFILICTVRSQAHLKGLFDYLNAYLKEKKVEPINSHKKPGNHGWVLVDCGSFVINLMDREKRNFYELEKLWFKGLSIYHSSKSS